MTILVVVVAAAVLAPLALLLVVWVGSRLLKDPGPASSGGNAFGGFDVFDPGRERGREDLESQKTQIVVTPATGDDHLPVRVDTDSNTVRVPRRRDAPPSGSLP